MNKRSKSLDTPTPRTDAVIDELLAGDGVPKCSEWDRMVEHAREMERMAAAYRALAIAYNRATA
jgi:hypothetical protein